MNHANQSNGQARHTPMDIKLLVVDETRFYPPEIQERAGRIYQTYAYDAARGYHAGDITPSFELHPLHCTPLNYLEDDAERDALHDELCDANLQEQQPRSWYCDAVRRMPETHKKDYHVVELDDDDEYDVQFERVLDRLRGNVQLELPAHVH